MTMNRKQAAKRISELDKLPKLTGEFLGVMSKMLIKCVADVVCHDFTVIRKGTTEVVQPAEVYEAALTRYREELEEAGPCK